MRCKLSDSKSFFDEILTEKNISLKQFSKLLNENYSTLKKYRRGEWTLPEDVFERIIIYSKKRDYWKNNLTRLQDNWGGVKGGEVSAKRDPLNVRLINARKSRKIPEFVINLDEFFCEFYGMLLGDGCISHYSDSEGKDRYLIQISCNKKLDSDYLKYLKNEIKKRYNIYAYYYEYRNRNVCTLSIKNKSMCIKLNKELSVPIGLKYHKLKISEKISSLSWQIKKYVLRGLFDTDGCIVANKRENYRYPWIVITSKSKKFRNQLIKMLKEQNYPAYNTGSDVCVRGITNVKRWFSDIGSSNSRNLQKYEYFLKHHCLPARLLGP